MCKSQSGWYGRECRSRVEREVEKLIRIVSVINATAHYDYPIFSTNGDALQTNKLLSNERPKDGRLGGCTALALKRFLLSN
jgi:hypothetical protein